MLFDWREVGAREGVELTRMQEGIGIKASKEILGNRLHWIDRSIIDIIAASDMW